MVEERRGKSSIAWNCSALLPFVKTSRPGFWCARRISSSPPSQEVVITV
jgi:hypothetical protein